MSRNDELCLTLNLFKSEVSSQNKVTMRGVAHDLYKLKARLVIPRCGFNISTR